MGGSCGLGEAVRAGWWVKVRLSPCAAKKQRCFCSCTVPSCGFLPLAGIFNVQFCNSAKGEGFCRACAEQSPAECLCHHVPPVGLCSPVWLHGPPVRGVALVPLAPVALGRALTFCHQGSARSEACCYTHPERRAPKPVSFPLVTWVLVSQRCHPGLSRPLCPRRGGVGHPAPCPHAAARAGRPPPLLPA